jgi:uncharacterized protein (DUF952 family)/catechol 2,3-dioxygenase-like lactoylglutathione lyase family enzyme
MRIFHITSGAEAAAAARSGTYVPEPYARDGFIHCSYREQVIPVASRFYAGRDDLVLLEIDRERLSATVVDENLDGGAELFPHLYGHLPMSAVVAVHALRRSEDGSYVLPETVGATIDVLANIDVDDLERATDFYCRALGLRVGRRLGEDAVELLGGPVAIYLLRKPRGSLATETAAQRRDYARHWTPVHLDFVVPEMDVAVATARAAGARLEGEVQTHPWGRLARLADPFGNGLCLIEFRGRGYDEIAT